MDSTSFFVLTGWLIVIFATFWRVGRQRVGSLGFLDGIVFGMAVYICIPMIFILYFGYYTNSVLLLPTFNVYSDVSCDIQLFIGAAIVLIFARLRRKHPFLHQIGKNSLFNRQFKILLGMFIILSLILFLAEGKDAGGDWADNVGTAITQNPILLLPLRVTATLKAGLFGLIVLLFLRKELSFSACIGYGSFITIFDVFTSFNRITIMYFGVVIFLLLKGRQKIWFTFSVIALAPTVGYVSSAWGMFRQLALLGGYNLTSFNQALERSIDAPTNVDGIFDTLNSLTEASNIQVFDYITQHYGYDLNYLWGQTFILRGLFGFLPIQIIFTRAPTFANMIGMHLSGMNSALNSTLFGELYANFSDLWPIPFVLVVLLINRLELALTRTIPGINYFFFFLGFAWWRFDMEYVVTSVIFIVAIMFFLDILKINPRKPRSDASVELQSH